MKLRYKMECKSIRMRNVRLHVWNEIWKWESWYKMRSCKMGRKKWERKGQKRNERKTENKVKT